MLQRRRVVVVRGGDAVRPLVDAAVAHEHAAVAHVQLVVAREPQTHGIAVVLEHREERALGRHRVLDGPCLGPRFVGVC
mgnify:FL=1